MGKTATRTVEGNEIIYVSHRPDGTYSYFCGAGDANGQTGEGDMLLFDLLSTDTSKFIDITFAEDIHIKDGFLTFTNAPLGAYIDVDIRDPYDDVIMPYVKKIPLLGSSSIKIMNEDREVIPYQLKIRVTVFNSTTDPQAFKLCGFLGIYRQHSN